MITVGLTGGFGSGKSFVAGLFKGLGAKVVDADKLAHRTLEKGTPTYKRIVAAFGSRILDRSGAINRKRLGSIVFGDRKKLARLNKIVHPVVIGRIKRIMKTPGKGVLVIDAPLICETRLSDIMDAIVVVKASHAKQIERCIRKFNLGEVDVKKRMACQIPPREKERSADYIIDNNGTRKGTKKQVTRVWQKLKKGETVWR